MIGVVDCISTRLYMLGLAVLEEQQGKRQRRGPNALRAGGAKTDTKSKSMWLHTHTQTSVHTNKTSVQHSHSRHRLAEISLALNDDFRHLNDKGEQKGNEEEGTKKHVIPKLQIYQPLLGVSEWLKADIQVNVPPRQHEQRSDGLCQLHLKRIHDGGAGGNVGGHFGPRGKAGTANCRVDLQDKRSVCRAGRDEDDASFNFAKMGQHVLIESFLCCKTLDLSRVECRALVVRQHMPDHLVYTAHGGLCMLCIIRQYVWMHAGKGLCTCTHPHTGVTCHAHPPSHGWHVWSCMYTIIHMRTMPKYAYVYLAIHVHTLEILGSKLVARGHKAVFRRRSIREGETARSQAALLNARNRCLL